MGGRFAPRRKGSYHDEKVRTRITAKRFAPVREGLFLDAKVRTSAKMFVCGRKGQTAVNQLSLIDFTKFVNAAAGPASSRDGKVADRPKSAGEKVCEGTGFGGLPMDCLPLDTWFISLPDEHLMRCAFPQFGRGAQRKGRGQAIGRLASSFPDSQPMALTAAGLTGWLAR